MIVVRGERALLVVELALQHARGQRGFRRVTVGRDLVQPGPAACTAAARASARSRTASAGPARTPSARASGANVIPWTTGVTTTTT